MSNPGLTNARQGGTAVTTTIDGAVTRPADVIPYTINDAMANAAAGAVATTLANCAREEAGGGVIINVICIDSANVAAKPDIELWIFDTAVTAINDNVAFTITDVEAATNIAVIHFEVWDAGDDTVGAGGNCVSRPILDQPIEFTCGAGLRDLFALWKFKNAYVPVASETFTARVQIDQNYG